MEDTGNFYRQEVRHILGLDIVLFLLSAGSILLNGALLLFTYNRKAIDTILMAMIALLDLVSALCVFIGSIWKWASAYEVLKDNGKWCHVNALIGWSVSVSAFNITALLSLIRYLAIVRGVQLCHRLIILSAVAIFFSITLLFSVKQAINKPLVFPSGMYCASVWSDGQPASEILSIMTVIVSLPPPFIITVCYARVTSYYNRCVLSRNQVYIPKQLYRRRNSLILIIVCYILSLLPEFLQAFISIVFVKRMVPWPDAICKILIFLVTMVNPIFAFHSHEGINQDMLGLISRVRGFFSSR